MCWFFYLAFAFFSSVVSAGTPEGSEVLPSEPPVVWASSVGP